ncbi:carbohydrate-binding module family 50 protein [Amanita thiersii Skay4041]|uniref:Carbohydrate-binding module family 50 protein n=1 Tax=Amanita thiersii Skay4041 TaxID=703135 RepID=A0A2A9NAR6_9AGAR|nr:carbohydrate-binding module family 50 protein [Amanita thiersii Skay4041]
MGRWTQYDEDDYNLPEGMKRIGYDADTGCYYFKDRDGSIWQGESGARYGEMKRVSSPRASVEDDERPGDLEAAPTTRQDGYQLLSADGTTMAYKGDVNASAYRTLFPFFLLITVVLLLVWRLVLSPGLSGPTKLCPKPETLPYLVQPGDSCWEISKAHGCSLDQFRDMNVKVQCDRLLPGSIVCVPDRTRSTKK